MATQTTGGGSTTSFTKTPQASDDAFLYDEEELSGYTALLVDVMSDDLGGNSKILWSIDDGTNDSGLMNGYVAGDLLTQDQLTYGVSQWQQTDQGSWIRINCGKVEYRLGDGTSSNPDNFAPIDFDSLPQGLFTDTFIYAIRMANGTLSWATVTVNIQGANDAPTVTALTGSVGEDGPSFSEDLLSGTDDVDIGAALNVVDAEASLTTDGGRVLELGTHYTVTGSTFALTAAGFALFNNLPQGDSDSFVFDYGVSDGIATTPNSLTITVTGTNDDPVAVVDTASATEDGSVVTGSVAGNDSDPDDGETASLEYELDAPVAGLTLGLDGSYSFDPSHADYQHLAAGATTDVIASYTVTDVHGASDTATLTITVTGTNDNAVITAVDGGDYGVTEAGGVANAIVGDPDAAGQVSVSDPDDGEDSFQTPALLAGTYGTFTFDPADGQWTYVLDNDLAATQALNVGPPVTDTLTVTSLDGSDSHDIVINIFGTNDAAVIAGDDQGEVTEEGAASPGDPDDTGTLSAEDVDNSPNSFQASAGNSTYGSFSINASGQWTYTLNNAHPALATLAAGLFLVDSFVVHAADGTAHTVEIQINGADDVIIVTPPPTETGADPNDFDSLTGGFVVTGNHTANNTSDTFTGDDGNQTLNGQGGNDVIYGQGGNDNINGNNDNDTLYGQVGSDVLSGNGGDDTLYGGSGGDTLNGNNEIDILYGGSGDDFLNGLNGDDILIGGYGADTLDGGGGNDTFRYLSTLDTNDLILDFMDSGNDQIDLSALDANSLLAGNQDFVWGGNTPTAHGLWFEQLGDDTVLYADVDGNAATAEFMVTLADFSGFGGFADPLIMPPDITP